MNYWENMHNKGNDIAHYQIFKGKDSSLNMKALRLIFPNGKADEANLCLFSTSGIHGSYLTIEDVEEIIKSGKSLQENDDYSTDITFLVIQPRLVCLRCGVCLPKNLEDIDFLKKVRFSSHEVIQSIGIAV